MQNFLFSSSITVPVFTEHIGQAIPTYDQGRQHFMRVEKALLKMDV